MRNCAAISTKNAAQRQGAQQSVPTEINVYKISDFRLGCQIQSFRFIQVISAAIYTEYLISRSPNYGNICYDNKSVQLC